MVTLPRSLVFAFTRRFLNLRSILGKPPAKQRSAMERIVPPLPRGVTRTAVNEPGVRGEWLAPAGAGRLPVLYYLHGGGYRIGSCKTHRELAARLAREAGCRVFSLEYRLSPEHPFPAAHDDAVAGYEWLRAQGVPAASIVVAGDSAGGGLALSLALGARDRGLPAPAGLVLFSPWTDLANTGASVAEREARDPMLDRAVLELAAAGYAGGHDRRHPLLSPLYADLRGLPPVFVQAGTEEVLYDDTVRLVAKLRDAGVPVECEIAEGLWHVWQLMGSVLPEARAAHRAVGRFVRERTRQPVKPGAPAPEPRPG